LAHNALKSVTAMVLNSAVPVLTHEVIIGRMFSELKGRDVFGSVYAVQAFTVSGIGL
jgi:hypothetical protein